MERQKFLPLREKPFNRKINKNFIICNLIRNVKYIMFHVIKRPCHEVIIKSIIYINILSWTKIIQHPKYFRENFETLSDLSFMDEMISKSNNLVKVSTCFNVVDLTDLT